MKVGERVRRFRLSGSAFGVLFVLVYVGVVLAVDTLAAHNVKAFVDWGELRWRGPWGTDLFKLVFWLVVPLWLSLPGFDWGWYGVRRWRRVDWWLLAGLTVAGAAAVAIIPLVPSLRALYGGGPAMRAGLNWGPFWHGLAWTLSWLFGWEFMHRYFMLRPLAASWPRWGWLLVPISEGLYHLQKPLIEAAGMVAFSLVVTYWATKRRNGLLPFLAHFMVEAELLVFRLVM